MNHWDVVRQKARTYHQMMLETCSGNSSATALLEAAAQRTRIRAYPLPEGDALLDGSDAVLDQEAGAIWYNQALEQHLIVVYIAHEYAHFWLDGMDAQCQQGDMEVPFAEEPGPIGPQQIEGYGPKERREQEANVFAREFLLPSPTMKQWYESEGLNATAIANRVGVSRTTVFHQLPYALLTPELSHGREDGEERSGEPLLLDASQQEAIKAPGPILIEAGPGTGKTRAMIGRILHLLKQEVKPSSILVLTFSKNAAEELHSRVRLVAPDAARRVWVGTFHAFGLELVRKFGTRLGLPAQVTVIDPVESLFLLERLLPSLGLEYYQNLYEPTMYLRDLFSAISRAKDELTSPATYTRLAECMQMEAQTQKEREAANKALEVARVYTLYQEALQKQSLLDFGDLIFQPVTLLQSHQDICTLVQQTYPHILVDEYQDVNRASGMLLRTIAGTGEGLWVVGDTRQAIYRFRGATSANMRLFPTDFPHASRYSLRYNYRSHPGIIAVFTAVASSMQASKDLPGHSWEATRPDSGEAAHLTIVEDAVIESTVLAKEIIRQQQSGISYNDQAVLCRTHATLAQTAMLLENAGIPVLYLGNLFERAEIRDLLSLVSLVYETHGQALIRVARFPEYQIPLADVQIVLSLVRERHLPFSEALLVAQDLLNLSSQGKRGLKLLAQHLNDLWQQQDAWSLLMHYLFERSHYLRSIQQDTSVAGQQRRAALYQFLQCAYEYRKRQDEHKKKAKQTFLTYIRWLETFGEDRPFRKMPPWTQHIDAVQLLTIHASKGLEFGAVYLPLLNQGYFPSRRHPQPCPPPLGMLRLDDLEKHDEEEECLFFVALSRAKNILSLSHVQHLGGRKSNPSSLLTSLKEPLLPRTVHPQIVSSPGERLAESIPLPDSPPLLFDVKKLELYMRCPRHYFYEVELGLRGKRMDSIYLQFHRCTYNVIHWLLLKQANKSSITEEMVQQQLAAQWEKDGPRNHPYEQIYRQQAERLVSHALIRWKESVGTIARPLWQVPLRNGTVSFTPDFTEVQRETGEPSIIVQRWHPGPLSQSEQDKDIYALYQAGAKEAHPGMKQTIQVVSLATGTTKTILLPERTLLTRLEHYNAAMAGIRRRTFPAQPSEHLCPGCPYYFICPIAEDDAQIL